MLQIKNTLGGGKPEGMYVWKKYDCTPSIVVENPSFTFPSYSAYSTDSLIATANNFNWVDLESRDFRDFVIGFVRDDDNSKAIYKNSSESVVIPVKSGSVETTFACPTGLDFDIGVWPYNETQLKMQFSSNSNSSPIVGATFTFEGVKTLAPVKPNELIGYVVSDKETAYPDGGEKGGYWYERVGGGLTPEIFGCSKMAVEDKTYSSNTSMYNSGNGITHSLGVAPKVVILLAKTSVTSEMISFFYNGNEPISGTSKYIYTYISYGSVNISGEAMSNLTDSKIITSGNVYLGAGVTYTLITMA